MDSNRVEELIRKIVSQIEGLAVSQNKMFEDIKFMRFKIRPIGGDLSLFNKQNIDILRSLWKIGKIDELLRANLVRLNKDEKNEVLNFLQSFEKRAQKQMKRDLRECPPGNRKKLKVLKIEIFRDEQGTQNIIN